MILTILILTGVTIVLIAVVANAASDAVASDLKLLKSDNAYKDIQLRAMEHLKEKHAAQDEVKSLKAENAKLTATIETIAGALHDRH